MNSSSGFGSTPLNHTISAFRSYGGEVCSAMGWRGLAILATSPGVSCLVVFEGSELMVAGAAPEVPEDERTLGATKTH